MTMEEALRRLNIEVDLIPAGSSNRPGTPIRATHITIHNTDNSARGADARMHARYLKGPDARGREVSWHFSVDDMRCIKHLPTNEMGWHAGRGNDRSVAIEICQHRGIDQNAAIERAALLAAVLMRSLGIDRADHVVQHNHWTGKDCPRVIRHRYPGGFARFVEITENFRAQLGAGGGGGLQPAVAAAGEETAVAELSGAGSEGESFDVSDLLVEPAETAETGTFPALGAESTVGERIALLERLLGQKEARIAELEQALERARGLLNEAP